MWIQAEKVPQCRVRQARLTDVGQTKRTRWNQEFQVPITTHPLEVGIHFEHWTLKALEVMKLGFFFD